MSEIKTNVIYCGDCQNTLHQNIPDDSVDMVYADPPFFSEKQYEVIWKDGYEIRAYEDRWKGGINNYLAWMEQKLRECQRILKPTGLLYLHCDWHAGHYLKVECDKIFGIRNFRNEIVWCYSGGGVSKKNFPSKHDTIFRYSKSDNYMYFPEYKAYSQGTMQRGRTKIKGKYFDEGLRKEGTPVTDWWTDIKYIHSPTDKERLGYPTQKSEELLNRIIKTSTNPMDIVLDPFCGCGTALASAHKLGRRWIGADVSPTACKLVFKRLQKLNPTLKIEETIIGLPKTVADIHRLVPFEFQNWVVQRLGARVSNRKVGDMGIDGMTFDLKPIQVKQSESIGRNVIDNFETAMQRIKAKKGIIIAYSFGKGAYEEVARAKTQDGLEIELMTVEDIIKL